ncbi:MAG TPA: hypothetical protein VIY69_15745 [Candidatus Acidoferrales bacterium]
MKQTESKTKMLSWLVVLLGFVIGFYFFAVFGLSSASWGDRYPAWYLAWFDIAGTGLLGATFIAGSLAALRSRKSAGLIFLIVIPAASYLLAAQTAGFLVWYPHEGGVFETPWPHTGIGLTILFFAPFFLLPLARRHKKLGMALFVAALIIAVVVFSKSRWTPALIPRLAGWSSPFALFGAFWLGTHKLGWSQLTRPPARSTRRNLVVGMAICFAVLFTDVAATLILAVLTSSLFSPDCNRKPPFVRAESSAHAVFTTHIFFVGHSLGLEIENLFSHPTLDREAGDWAIGVVQERFWGLASWESHFVLLTDYVYWRGETYFVDGGHDEGLLTRFLPIVGGGINCSRTRPLAEAGVDLRLLHETNVSHGGHIIGYVREPQKFRGGWARPEPPVPAVGAKINVEGPTGSSVVTTDGLGLYELKDLPQGAYTLELNVPANQVEAWFDASTRKVHINEQSLVEESFDLAWNGRIEGRVLDRAGKPARVWVQLKSADGSQLPGDIRDYLQTKDDGSYEIEKIPPGRYFIAVDSPLPDGSLHTVEYYPSASRPEDAQVIELSEGQELKGVDLTVPWLSE